MEPLIRSIHIHYHCLSLIEKEKNPKNLITERMIYGGTYIMPAIPPQITEIYKKILNI